MKPAPTPRILVTQPLYGRVLQRLTDFATVEMNPGPEPWAAAELRARAAEADGLLTFMTDHLDEAFLAACPRLRMIGCALKGADNFDLDACRRRGVAVSVVPDLLTAPTAELAVGLLIGLGRNLRAGDALVRGGGFAGWRPILYGAGLDGATVGLLGFGRVGQAVAARLQGFGCRLVGHDAAAPPPPGVAALPLDALLPAADALVLALPLTPSTRHILDAARLAALPPHALVVNVARGSLVDEAAVAEALHAGRLGGYAADVFALEDWALPDRPRAIPPALLAHPRTLFTPHLGSAVAQVREAIEMSAAESLAAFFAGARVPGLVV
ncbi:NAD(P)-dependent oxidoreductase [Falsiroseomonas selenitidurans]|uniref:Hydroxyacid dehydrogenase n=1 Tax=Falsiroseomonas selenitidurans TaxID=2716335 RepID=A0ABX1E1Z8_9PROT|nr:NAD(P)-dependent oxidoreductase [Falsiroseomonas selenitidurans]NKC31083.1 hydroxyacid dehydrogenase [Falsiroseomonas selenitidurans]